MEFATRRRGGLPGPCVGKNERSRSARQVNRVTARSMCGTEDRGGGGAGVDRGVRCTMSEERTWARKTAATGGQRRVGTENCDRSVALFWEGGGRGDWRPDWRKEKEAKVEHARQGPNSTERAPKTNEWAHRGELNGPRLAGVGRGRKAMGPGSGNGGW
jgi:hypothetical protein